MDGWDGYADLAAEAGKGSGTGSTGEPRNSEPEKKIALLCKGGVPLPCPRDTNGDGDCAGCADPKASGQRLAPVAPDRIYARLPAPVCNSCGFCMFPVDHPADVEKERPRKVYVCLGFIRGEGIERLPCPANGRYFWPLLLPLEEV